MHKDILTLSACLLCGVFTHAVGQT